MSDNYPYSDATPGPRDNFYSMDTLRGSEAHFKGSSPNLHADSFHNLPGGSTTSLPTSPFLKGTEGSDGFCGLPKETLYPESRPRRRRGLHKRPWFWVVVVAVGVAAGSLAVYFAVVRPQQKRDESRSSSSGDVPQQKPVSAVQIGQDGSTVAKEDGSTFTYKNSFGGYCESSAFILIVDLLRGLCGVSKKSCRLLCAVCGRIGEARTAKRSYGKTLSTSERMDD